MDGSFLHAIRLWQTWYDCVRLSGRLGWHTLIPGHYDLFARQLPIALSFFEYLDTPVFSRRRFYLFAIMHFA